MLARVLKVDGGVSGRVKFGDIINVAYSKTDAYDYYLDKDAGYWFHASSLDFNLEIEVGDMVRINVDSYDSLNYTGMSKGKNFTVREMYNGDDGDDGHYWLRPKYGAPTGILSDKVTLIKKGSKNMNKSGKNEESDAARALRESVEHYEKMIYYVGGINMRDMNNSPSSKTMESVIGESWMGDHCSLCTEYDSNEGCRGCQLGDANECSEGAWEALDDSASWVIWLDNAKSLLGILERLYKEECGKQRESERIDLRVGDIWEDKDVYLYILSVPKSKEDKVEYHSLYKKGNKYLDNNVALKWFFSRSNYINAKLIHRA